MRVPAAPSTAPATSASSPGRLVPENVDARPPGCCGQPWRGDSDRWCPSRFPDRNGPPAWLALTWAVLAPGAHGADDAAKEVRPFLERHCVRCHGEAKAKGDFRLDTLGATSPSPGPRGDGPRSWTGSTRARCRRPKEPRPKADEAARVAEWIASRIAEAEAARKAATGREGLVPQALARGVSQHDPRPAGRDLRRERPRRPARRPGLAGVRADRARCSRSRRRTSRSTSRRPSRS